MKVSLKKLMRLGQNPFRVLEKRLGYSFKKQELLAMALTHPSYRFEQMKGGEDNQRLEFLGDASLSLAAAAYIYKHYSDHDEGRLTLLRSRLTNGKTLAQIAHHIELGAFLSLGKGEDLSGGRRRDSVLADALEAILGAAYLDGSQLAIDRILKHLFIPFLKTELADPVVENPKGQLQALAQKRWGIGPCYHVVEESGPLHSRVFTVEVTIGDEYSSKGTASSKREAEAHAASALLTILNSHSQSLIL